MATHFPHSELSSLAFYGMSQSLPQAKQETNRIHPLFSAKLAGVKMPQRNADLASVPNFQR
jgi:hypothetical protein